MDERVRHARELADGRERLRRVTDLLSEHQEATVELSRIRRETIEELRQEGLSQTEVAAIAGLSRGRIGQLAKTGPPAERAFLGDGALTVVIGQKKEEGRDQPVIALETTKAFDRLKELATSYQLDASMEPVPPPGLFDLNRDNLIVLAGPRLFPLVGQILASDPNLRFDTDPDGTWILRDLQTEDVFRAARDQTKQPRDFGYLGRLPRPDGRGTFLCMAGLHATGTQGVVAFLETAMAELYATVKTGRFSTVIECEYDPAVHNTVITAKQASPIYRS